MFFKISINLNYMSWKFLLTAIDFNISYINASINETSPDST